MFIQATEALSTGVASLGLAPTPASCKIHGRVLRTKFAVRLDESGEWSLLLSVHSFRADYIM
jgi:hypothetical protein